MTATTSLAGASTNLKMSWESINWKKARKEVRQIQVRIAKATKQGRFGKVKALQLLLSRSFYAKLLAVKKVTDNKGGKTPGVDGITWKTSKQKMEATLDLKKKGYKTKPLRRIYIPKWNGKLRPLSIPTMKCRAMQALYLLGLEPVSETLADPNSYGFRPKRSTADAIEQCFNLYARRGTATWVLEADIKSCFDEIDHDWLISNIPMDKKMLRKWLKAGYVENKALFKTERGTPQGGIISPCLLTMTMSGLERALKESWPVKNPQKINIVTYADDFIVSGASKEVLEEKVMPTIEKFLKSRGLRLSQEKTKISKIEDGFDFLGFNIRRYKSKLLIKPSKKSILSHTKRLREVIKSNKTAKTEVLVRQLNPKIRGWANYFCHVTSKRIFGYIDNSVYHSLWRWCCRRHPNKGRRWIKSKYFKILPEKGNWNFGVIGPAKPDGLFLYKANSTPIKRHVKIKAQANPYNPEYFDYFYKRSSGWSPGHSYGLKKA